MERAPIAAQLPPAYVEALLLYHAGVSDSLIIDRLGIVPEALPTFLQLAEAKLTESVQGLLRNESPGDRLG